MHEMRFRLPKFRLFHWCLVALVPAAIFVIGLRLGAFPRANWAIKRAVALTVGSSLHLSPNLEPARLRLLAASGPKTAIPLKDSRIVICKSRRRAELYSGDKLVKSYRVVLGESAQRRKTRIGDGRTPEGQYRICACLYRSTFHIFLGLNYPSASDGKKALNQHLITKKDFQRIAKSEHKRRKPPWDTPIGGAIGLHGGGTDSDWPDGCIALNNADIEELCLAVQYWTPVEIRP
jgi:hypothetical protein